MRVLSPLNTHRHARSGSVARLSHRTRRYGFSASTMGVCHSSPPNTEPSNERSSEDKKGSDKDIKSMSGEDDLHTAARDGDVARVRTLIEAGADVNQTDVKGSTALTDAAAGEEAESSEAIVRALIEAGADVNKAEENAWPPLLVAATHGHEAVVRALIEAGADVNKKVKYGHTPLSRATENGNEAVAQLLRDAGAA